MTTKELNKILKDHSLWLENKGGKRADLKGADLKGADLRGANLQRANLQGANLQRANLQGTDLQGTDLQGANLQNADLRWADLQGADLKKADLLCANLQKADLLCANLLCANLRGANLQGADLQGANLQGVVADEMTSGFWSVCPEEGSFIAFKKLAYDKVAKLLIPEHAKRSSSTTRKCRCSEALVVEIKYKNGQSADIGYSRYEDWNEEKTMYTVGETVYPDSFDENRWNECSNGIHFFMTRQEAEDY